jgi:protein-tyrosine-phosphatase
MAEAYLREIFDTLKLNIHVNSCGVASNARDNMLISLDAKLVLKEDGIVPKESKSLDLKKHKEILRDYDLILTLTEKHKREVLDLNGEFNGEIYTLKEFAGKKGDIKDPSMKGVKGFRKARDEIKESIFQGLNRWFPNLTFNKIKTQNQ